MLQFGLAHYTCHRMEKPLELPSCHLTCSAASGVALWTSSDGCPRLESTCVGRTRRVESEYPLLQGPGRPVGTS
ncbi:rCG23500 [Rattus norvegicus]|uniref:RCG23500 n=1 Tax=Rattus norvegicus TaxID=10116 RepID=A6KHA2_RAT|nr:rCG23500 [Rattus norvegicus]